MNSKTVELFLSLTLKAALTACGGTNSKVKNTETTTEKSPTPDFSPKNRD